MASEGVERTELGVPGAAPPAEPPKIASPPPALASRLEGYKKASPEETRMKLEERMAAAATLKEKELEAAVSKAERFEKGLPGTVPRKGGAELAEPFQEAKEE